jgi:hypothetical protein
VAGEQLLHFSLGPAHRRAEQLILVRGGQPSGQELCRRHAERALSKQAEDLRECLACPCDLDAVIGLVLREMKLLHAVHMEGRKAGREVDRPVVHLGEVDDQFRDRVALSPHKPFHLRHELRIGKRSRR